MKFDWYGTLKPDFISEWLHHKEQMSAEAGSKQGFNPWPQHSFATVCA